MSGVVSAVGTVFSSVASTAANVGSAIMGVGASLFTGGAATGVAGGALGGMFGGTLGNVIGGAVRTGAIGALVGGAIGAATGQGFGRGALIGGLGGAAMGGLGAAMGPGGMMGQGAQQAAGITAAPGQTATGMAASGNIGTPQSTMPGLLNSTPMTQQVPPIGASTVPAAQGAAAAGGGMGGLFQGETGGQILAGLGQGAMGWLQSRNQAREGERNRAHELALLRERDAMNQAAETRQEQRYAGMPTFAAAQDSGEGRQTPGEKYARTSQSSGRYMYDPQQGRIVFSA